MPIILASKSPRRQALLARITHDFIVIPSHADESSQGTPREQVMTSARSKARAVGEKRDGIILGADTIVVLGDTVMGKPRSRDDADRMLRSLSGKTHSVLTGVYLWDTHANIEKHVCAETSVQFRLISDEEIQWYLDSGEYADKAGGYAIQGRAAVFVQGIVGEYTNVMGLPLCELSRLLRDIGVTL